MMNLVPPLVDGSIVFCHARTPVHQRYPFHHALLFLTLSAIHCSLPPLLAKGGVWAGCGVVFTVWGEADAAINVLDK
jgi:hypothetical protein